MLQMNRKTIPTIKHIILVASGKGGVGKSTIASALAILLSQQGHRVGLLDADLFGPSVPLLFGLQDEKLQVKQVHDKQFLVPFTKNGLKLMSIGFLVEPHQAAVWRGPRVSAVVSQLLNDTDWGELDYLLIDTPPGTGDIHITLLQNFSLSGVVIVTTPQEMSLVDVKKSINLFQSDKLSIPILGIVENMSFFTPIKHPDEKYFLFGKGGGEAIAKEFHVPLLSQIPMDESICTNCDEGRLEKMLTSKGIAQAFDVLIKQMLHRIING